MLRDTIGITRGGPNALFIDLDARSSRESRVGVSRFDPSSLDENPPSLYSAGNITGDSVVTHWGDTNGDWTLPIDNYVGISALGDYGPARSSTTLELQARLRAQWASALDQARQLEAQCPDPVGAITDLFANLPGDYASWREIIEEPYG